MNKTFQRRIADMQARADLRVNEDCATCRAFPGIVIMDDDGTMSRPETCPDCGRQVPIVRLIHIVGVPLDLR